MKYPTTYAVFDLETSGLDPKVDKILQIGCVTYIDNKPNEFLNMFLKWDRLIIPDKITKINGIDRNKMNAEGQDPRMVLSRFFELTKGFPLVGHNIFKFDIPFLIETVNQLKGVDVVSPTMIHGVDTAALYKAHVVGESQDWTENLFKYQMRILGTQYYGKKFSLTVACDEFGIDRKGGQHEAMKDILLTQQVYEKLCFQQTIPFG